jgi:hypothetical protein
MKHNILEFNDRSFFKGIDSFAPPAPVRTEASVFSRSPRAAWEIHDHLKCPVIGICLELQEQKKLLKKTYPVNKINTFEIHELLVSKLLNENNISRRLTSYLSRKYRAETLDFFDKDISLFLDTWESHLKKGEETAGLLWVAAIRPDLTEDHTLRIFGSIHMAMHMSLSENTRLGKELCLKEDKNRRLKQMVQDLNKINRSSEKEKAKPAKELAELQQRHAALKKEMAALRDSAGNHELETENRQLQESLKTISKALTTYQKEVKALKHQNDKLISKLEKQRGMNLAIKKELEAYTLKISAMSRCDETCPSFDLCQKRILLVGGIDRMKVLYRQVVEQAGGKFEYHDGHLKGGIKGLRNQVRRADMVLCQININSHNACLMTKKLAKKYDKPFEILAAGGISGLAEALSGYRSMEKSTLAHLSSKKAITNRH